MPPIQPSFRASLLTGASALALSVSTSGVNAQTAPIQFLPETKLSPQTLQVWIEGGQSWGGGGNINIPTFPGLTAPFTSFGPGSGYEFAVGADWRPQGQPYHYVFDFRYGHLGTRSVRSNSNSTFGGYLTGTENNYVASSGNTKSSTVQSKWESHLAADLMIGRELGIGMGSAEMLFGVRVADLHANASTLVTNQNTGQVYAESFLFGYDQLSPINNTTTNFARWNSRFFGAGPRVGVTGSVPIQGKWSFDYSGDVAGLIGDSTFKIATWTNGIPGFAANYGGTAFVFNADASAAFSFIFTKNYKWSVGIRADYYNSALKTYNVSTGGLSSIDRVYWGPFMRFTGTF